MIQAGQILGLSMVGKNPSFPTGIDKLIKLKPEAVGAIFVITGKSPFTNKNSREKKQSQEIDRKISVT